MSVYVWPGVLELPISWVERDLESKATRFLKKWLQIPQVGNLQFLYLPRADCGLALPALSTLYKQQQSSRHVIFRSSQDECVHFLEANTRYHYKGKFSVAFVVPDEQSHNTASTKQQLKTRVSQHILAEDSAVCREHLTSLRVHGQVFHMDCDLSYWSEAVSSPGPWDEVQCWDDVQCCYWHPANQCKPCSLVPRPGVCSVQALWLPHTDLAISL